MKPTLLWIALLASCGDAMDPSDPAVEPVLLFERIVDGNRDIWRIGLDGTDLRRITSNPAEDAWPFAVNRYVYYLSYRSNPAAVFRIHADSTQEVQLTAGSATFDEIAVAPDGQRIAFTRQVSGLNKIYVSNIDGSGARRLTNSGDDAIEAAPAWSRDGSNIAFVSTIDGNADIFSAPAAGGASQLIAGGPFADFEPAWSPTSDEFAFARGSPGQLDIFIGAAGGAEARRITMIAGSETRPVWLRDGRIVFAGGAGPARQLFWVDPSTQMVHSIPGTVAVAGRAAELR